MRKYGKWVLTLGLLAATPGLTLAAGPRSKADDRSAPTSRKTSQAENQRVAEGIAEAMRGKVSGDINIEYRNGIASLTGTVLDQKTKDKATGLVEKVDGVMSVDNQLQVVPKKRQYTARMSENLSSAGAVVSANHRKEGSKAERVQQVNGEMPVSGASNQEVAEQIGAALTAANLDGYDIQIRYQNGVAMLDGSVGTQAERANASRVVSTIPGVRSVSNRLTCTEEPSPRNPRAQQAGYGPAGPYGPGANVQGAGYLPGGPAGMMPGQPGPGQMPGAGPMGPGPMPSPYGYGGGGLSQASYNNPGVPDYAWPSYAQYPNSAAVNYPTQYSANAFPYIGPFYPYPQVPLGWRDATLRWDDGQWNLMFRSRTDKWWWFLNPHNW